MCENWSEGKNSGGQNNHDIPTPGEKASRHVRDILVSGCKSEEILHRLLGILLTFKTHTEN